VASVQKRQNIIHTLQNGQEKYCKHEEKAQILFDYFCNLMGKDGEAEFSFNFEQLYQGLPRPEQNHVLEGEIATQEIEMAICTWPNNKAPGPDGFTGEFYKTFKTLLMPDIKQILNLVMRNLTLTLKPLNGFYIFMIPKSENVIKPTYYMPISVIHGIQRIFSNNLERIQLHLPLLIQPTQTSFVKGRNIFEGFIYAQEVISVAKKQNKKITLFKLDIFKAFDSVNWSLIINCLKARGFSDNWIKWIEYLVL
jgi:Reverse transcriptase (RNA-dependent DNA polymerase)